MSSTPVDYALFNISARDAAAPEDLSPDNRANSRFSAYFTDAPLVAHNQPQSTILFAAQQALVPAFSVDGASSAAFINDDNLLRFSKLSCDSDKHISYFRLGATTPLLAKGSFLVDNESKLIFH